MHGEEGWGSVFKVTGEVSIRQGGLAVLGVRDGNFGSATVGGEQRLG